ncbi:MAG: DUF4388 domain-containing protein [Thermoanaerobaculia bacterium]
MEFTGRLGVFPASNLLQWAIQERASGTLVIRRSQREKRVGFRAGQIVECRSNQPHELYGHFLLLHGYLNAESLGKALVHCRTSRQPLGAALGELELLDEEMIRSTLSRAVTESVQDVFLWQQGLFYFLDQKLPDRRLELDLNSTEILLEGTRWIDELARIRGVLVDDEVVVAHGPGVGKTPYTALERCILEQCETESSIREIYARVGGIHFPFLSSLFDLLQRGALEIVRNGIERASDSRDIDLRQFLLSVESEDEVVVGSDSAIFPLQAIEALVPVWIQRPPDREIEALPIAQRAFLDGFDGRTTLRRLFSPAAETRADQIELLLVELQRRSVLLLPASLDDVERRLDESSPLRKLVRRLRG